LNGEPAGLSDRKIEDRRIASGDIPDPTFEIDEKSADRVWDADDNKFLRKE
jgi:hypothetical protein